MDGLAASISIEALITLFAGCGTVLSIELLPHEHEESLRIAKVQMGSAEEANQAVQVMNKTTLNGSLLVVLKESEFNAKCKGKDA
jgi:hypothetical protein